MIQHARVRRMPVRGLGGKKLIHNCAVYLDENWRGAHVVVLSYEDYLAVKKSAKTNRTKLDFIRELAQ